MVALKKMGWLSEIRIRSSENHAKSSLSVDSGNDSSHLGILAFEVAKTMSRLVSLYKSLSDVEISKLRKDVMKSEGVSYLNSKDEGYLLNLACAERLEELDKAAAVVARLGQKCKDLGLNRFDLVYTDLKLGIIDFEKSEYGSKRIERKVAKMEKLIAATSGLYTALDCLTELELSDRKLKQIKYKFQNPNFDHFNQKLDHQRKQVRHFREISLWSKTFDKSAGLMAWLVCIIYSRICSVFSLYNPILSPVLLQNMQCTHKKEIFQVQPEFCLVEPIKDQILPHSGPIQPTQRPTLVRFYSRKSTVFSGDDNSSGGKTKMVFEAAGPSTVGGSGLALRYANVILLAQKYLESTEPVDSYARESLYEMLPENLKALVRSKLSKKLKSVEDDELLAEGWREAVTKLMGWLLPMAHDTVEWHMAKNFEKKKFDTKPLVLVLQTLHFSDKEKTEAAIAEVLVGLSYIFRLENRQSCVS